MALAENVILSFPEGIAPPCGPEATEADGAWGTVVIVTDELVAAWEDPAAFEATTVKVYAVPDAKFWNVREVFVVVWVVVVGVVVIV